jgi:Zn-finger nucleic acid-binding protein
MVVLELEEIELDHCLSCGGIWLDAGELELLIGAPDRATALTSAFSDLRDTGGEPSRKCPICSKLMIKTATAAGDTALTLDRCPQGHGIWFDDGELHTLLACIDCGRDSRTLSLVKDMFKARIANKQGE